MAASRTHLAKHIQDNPILERAAPNNQVSNDMEREELKNALVATQVNQNMIMEDIPIMENKIVNKQ